MTKQDPTFKQVFGDAWHQLPPVMHRHYANRPYSDDVNICHGRLSVRSAPMVRLFWPIMRRFGGVPAVNADNIPVTVEFKSDPSDNSFHFKRTFDLPGEKPFIFHSRMVPQSGNQVTEILPFGLCWRIRYGWRDNKVILGHDGYAVRLFNKIIPLPLSWVIGHIHAEEEAITDTKFKMFVEIRHPLFGKIYEYRGEFEMEPES